MRLLSALLAFFVTSPAFAHELPGPHAHPHGDTAGSMALLAAIVAAGAVAFYLRRGSK